MSRSHLQSGDVLLSIIGTIGEASLVSSDRDATCSCKLAILRPHNIRSEYLAVYLRTRHGRSQIMRNTRGAVQMGFLLEDMDQIRIPRFSDDFEAAISESVDRSKRSRLESSVETEKSAQLLLVGLGVESWRAPEPLSYTQSSRDAFAAGRFDAEYFYPAKVVAQMLLATASDITVGDQFESVRKLWQPDGGESDVEVRNYDLNDALVPFLDGAKPPTSNEFIASAKKRVQEGDLVVSRLRSYLKEIAIVESGGDVPMVASTEFIVLRPKSHASLPVEALMIYLRSALPQLVFKWSQDGSNHPRFDEGELLRLPIPRAIIAEARQYVQSVQLIKSSRKRSTQLLEAAKRAVEIAIEDSEAAALKFLKSVAK